MYFLAGKTRMSPLFVPIHLDPNRKNEVLQRVGDLQDRKRTRIKQNQRIP